MAFGALKNIVDNLTGGQDSQKTADASSFTIDEITGQKRKVKLVGRALPYRPFELSGKQRVNTTWLPGYADATATVLGPEEENTTIHGFWKDRFVSKPKSASSAGSVLSKAVGSLQAVTSVIEGGGLGPAAPSSPADPITVSGTPIADVRNASNLFDDLRRQGQLLEVAWDQQVRRGFLLRFTQKWHNAHDMEWEMEFQWIGRAERAPAPDAEESSAVSALGALSAALTDMKALADELTALDAALRDAVDSTLQGLSDLVDTLSQGVTAVASLASIPAESARRTVGTLNSIVGECRSLAQLFDQQPYGGNHRDAQPRARAGDVVGVNQAMAEGLDVGDGGIASLTFAQRMTAAGQAKDMQRKSRAMSSIAVDRRATTAALLQDDLVGQVIAREGEDLRTVAKNFYGSPDEWRRLMVFNGLSSPRLRAGMLILVPRSSGEDLC